MNIGRKRFRANPIPKDREIYPEQDIDETLLHNTNSSNFEDKEDVWKYGDRIVSMGQNQEDCYIIGYIGSDNKLTRTPLSGFEYGRSPCPGDESEDDEDEEDEQYGGKKSRNRKTSREKKSKKRKSKKMKSKKMKSKKMKSKKMKSKKMKPRKNKSTRKH